MAQADSTNTIEHPAAAIARLRKDMQTAVDRLLAALDALEAPEEDLEETDPVEPDGDAEPSIGWADKEARTGRYHYLANDDREQEHDGREPDADLEPNGDNE